MKLLVYLNAPSVYFATVLFNKQPGTFMKYRAASRFYPVFLLVIHFHATFREMFAFTRPVQARAHVVP